MDEKQFIKEIHDAVRKTYVQGARSFRSGGKCAYDNGDGKRCVVGHMMTDEEFRTFGAVEAGLVDLVTGAGWRSGVYTDSQLHVLNELQECHDYVVDEGTFKKRFLSCIRRDLGPAYIPPELHEAAS